MLKIKYHSTFKKDYKRIVKRGYDTNKLTKVINLLVQEQELPPKYKDHNLKGNYKDVRECHKDVRECHIDPDWLLVYQISEEKLILYLIRTGTHSDIF